MKYSEFNAKLGTRTSRKLGNNTYLLRQGGDIAVKLHGTNVLTFKPDGSVVYDTGGWRTNTTRDRMNNHGADGFYIWQDKGIWSLGRAKGPRKLYEDGIIVTKRGRMIGGGNIRATKAAIKRKKQIDGYCKAFALALVDGKVGAPSGGDCWYCRLVTTGAEGKIVQTLGDSFGSHDHLLTHIKEGCFVPSLLQHAIEDEWAPVSIIVKSCIADIWNGKPSEGGLRNLIIPQVTKALRKYIKHRLGMVA
jgi:hypothetical protein